MLLDVLKGKLVLEFPLINLNFCYLEKLVLFFYPKQKVQKDLKLLHSGQVKIFKSSILFCRDNNRKIRLAMVREPIDTSPRIVRGFESF